MNKIVACRKRRIILERDIPDVVVDLVFGDLSSALSMLVVSGPLVKKRVLCTFNDDVACASILVVNVAAGHKHPRISPFSQASAMNI